MQGENRFARGIGRDRDEEMRHPMKRRRVNRAVAVEENGGVARITQRSRFLGAAAGAGHEPFRRREPVSEGQRGITEAEAEEMRAGHDSCLAGAGDGSASRVSAMRFCLKRLSIHTPQEMTAPTASGRRSPRLSLSDPISTAPTAGPARKIIP